MKTKVITKTRIDKDVEFDGKIVFKNSVEITGHLIAQEVNAGKNIWVHQSYVLYGNDKVGGSQNVGGYQEIDGDQEVGGSQNVGGSQEVYGAQKVGYSQEVGGSQNVGGSQEIGASQKVGGSQEVYGAQKVAGYHNSSFSVIDTTKLKTKRIRFTSSYYHERNFWLAQLEPIRGIDDLKDALKNDDTCWTEIIEIAKKNTKEILAYQHFLPAIRQAIEIMLSD